MNDREERRSRFTIVLRELVESLKLSLDDKNLKLLADFIDNREFVVALEWLFSIVKERSIPLTKEQDAKLRKIASDLEVDLDSIV